MRLEWLGACEQSCEEEVSALQSHFLCGQRCICFHLRMIVATRITMQKYTKKEECKQNFIGTKFHKKCFISHFNIRISFQVPQNYPLAPWKAEASSVLLGPGMLLEADQWPQHQLLWAKASHCVLTCTEQNQLYEHLHIGQRNWSILCSFPVCKKVRLAS